MQEVYFRVKRTPAIIRKAPKTNFMSRTSPKKCQLKSGIKMKARDINI
jgi:hypothetical protein